MHFLVNHPDLRKEVTETLKMRLHDSEELVRYEVVMAIVSSAKKACDVVSTSEDLLELVRERTLDKKVSRELFRLIFDAAWLIHWALFPQK